MHTCTYFAYPYILVYTCVYWYLCKSSLANWLNFFLQGKHLNLIFIWDFLAVLWSFPYKDPRNLVTHTKLFISLWAFHRLLKGFWFSGFFNRFSAESRHWDLISSYLTFLLFAWLSVVAVSKPVVAVSMPVVAVSNSDLNLSPRLLKLKLCSCETLLLDIFSSSVL